MKRALVALVLLLGGGVAFAATRRAAASPEPAQGGAPGVLDWPALDAWTFVPGPAPAGGIDTITAWIQANVLETQQKEVTMNPPTTRAANVAALLDAIGWAEGTANQPDPYRVCYAYSHTIQSFADHPYSLGEWPGVVLTAEQCRGAGLNPGCRSTAAGKFQITVTTWRRLKPKLGLVDFSPASQERAAIELLRERGALARIERGDLAGAVAAARSEWASLPGANYAGQGMRSMGDLQARYLNAGGSLA
ncbi:glycoside hydrolase family 24 protein [Hydrogenophaga laconesensis]|uniref:Lysozyme n=1 Tax=Hydrogenophaga laconesensis TaxID=1805971 RepID=A0ABU1VDH6_9BURK|nr:glycoside hydrolase family 104 protein [Hydrogenophaga laconesensis]MDR7095531.1 lysozyme [Hydrogenophaga laconesensis]